MLPIVINLHSALSSHKTLSRTFIVTTHHDLVPFTFFLQVQLLEINSMGDPFYPSFLAIISTFVPFFLPIENQQKKERG